MADSRIIPSSDKPAQAFFELDSRSAFAGDVSKIAGLKPNETVVLTRGQDVAEVTGNSEVCRTAKFKLLDLQGGKGGEGRAVAFSVTPAVISSPGHLTIKPGQPALGTVCTNRQVVLDAFDGNAKPHKSEPLPSKPEGGPTPKTVKPEPEPEEKPAGPNKTEKDLKRVEEEAKRELEQRKPEPPTPDGTRTRADKAFEELDSL